jgi:hypothetical protein
VIDRLGKDLQAAFPGVGGFSRTNVYRMRAFYLAYREAQAIVPQAVGQPDPGSVPPPLADIPWGHNVLLIEKLKDPAERLWYAHKTLEHGWSRAILDHQIDGRLYRRQGKAVINFERTLPLPQSDLAQQGLRRAVRCATKVRWCVGRMARRYHDLVIDKAKEWLERLPKSLTSARTLGQTVVCPGSFDARQLRPELVVEM